MMCYQNSFASHCKAACWSKENSLTPRSVFKLAKKKYDFTCEKGHKFKVSLYNIANGWCPKCKNKTEALLLEKLIENCYTPSTQHKFEKCINPDTNRRLPFDFVIDEFKIVIELDGRQHFEQVRNWTPLAKQRKSDLDKMEFANKNGYTVIRIFQEDVWKNIDYWFNVLEDHIFLHDVPTRVYISSGNWYVDFPQ